jgi:hypothetical protein
MTQVHGLAQVRELAPGPWQLFDLVGNGVAVTRSDGTLEYCNAALLQLMSQSANPLLGTSIFKLLDGGANQLEKLHRTALATMSELRTQVRCPVGRFVASAVMRRLDQVDGQRVVWSFVDARYNEPSPELALWGTEIGLWDWDVVNDRLTWINDWCEHSQLTAFSGDGHEKLWSSRIHHEDLAAYRTATWTAKLRPMMSSIGCAIATMRGYGSRNAAVSSSATRVEGHCAWSGCVSMPKSATIRPARSSAANPDWHAPCGDRAPVFGSTTYRPTPCIGGMTGAPPSILTPAAARALGPLACAYSRRRFPAVHRQVCGADRRANRHLRIGISVAHPIGKLALDHESRTRHRARQKRTRGADRGCDHRYRCAQARGARAAR